MDEQKKPLPEEQKTEKKSALDSWKPKTTLGKMVKEGKITSMNEILDNGLRILEPEITEMLLPNLESELLLIGQSKGKFGGGQRRVFKQTQKKTQDGNRPQFTTVVVVGNKDGYGGIGYGKSRETVPAREKALRASKLNVFKIRRGAGSWADSSTEPRSIPFTVIGKAGSVIVKLMPAPPGTGRCCHRELQKILLLAGIHNVWSKSYGHNNSTINLINACEKALRKLIEMKVSNEMNMVEGAYESNLQKEFEAVAK